MITEEHHKQEDIEDAAFVKYIGDEVIMYVPGEEPRRATVRSCVEDSHGTKVGTYHWNPLMDT